MKLSAKDRYIQERESTNLESYILRQSSINERLYDVHEEVRQAPPQSWRRAEQYKVDNNKCASVRRYMVCR